MKHNIKFVAAFSLFRAETVQHFREGFVSVVRSSRPDRWVVGTLVILCSFFIFSCQHSEELITESATAKPVENLVIISDAQYKNMGLELSDLAVSEMAEIIDVNGMVDVPPENVAMVSLPVTGFVKTLTHNVLPGKYVKKGSVLATAQSMDAVQLQQDYLEKFSQKKFLQEELERQQTLAAQDATAKRKLQEAESNLRVNEAMLNAFAAKLKIIGVSVAKLQRGEFVTTLPILAPISGYVKTVYINTGTNFTPADVLFELISKQHLHVELKVFEKDAFKLKGGQTVVFNDPRIGGKVEGKVFLVGKTFDADTKSINVHVHLSNEAVEQLLIPGQYLNAKIQTDSRLINVLPEAAISREGGKTFVYILDNKKGKSVSFKKVAVEIGVIQDGEVEIISPLNLQNVVVSKVTFIAGMGEEE
jgi:cobalt-zinc-cadmium efflux system membrane fusion protein